MSCNICTTICSNHVISKDATGVHFERNKCSGCGKCVEHCPQCAIELKGINQSIEYVASELIKDHAYFGTDGGITFSGGEPMLQLDPLIALIKLLRQSGIKSIALDTAGHYP
jgi:pyruvate formate lyase activating enzyme